MSVCSLTVSMAMYSHLIKKGFASLERIYIIHYFIKDLSRALVPLHL